jgi:hypothetical protein
VKQQPFTHSPEYTKVQCKTNQTFSNRQIYTSLIETPATSQHKICSHRFSVKIVTVLWCLMPLSTIFQLHRDGQFYWKRKSEKTTDLSQVPDKLYHSDFWRLFFGSNAYLIICLPTGSSNIFCLILFRAKCPVVSPSVAIISGKKIEKKCLVISPDLNLNGFCQ